MPDSPPPRIRVTLPDDRDLPGHLLRWRQDPDGQWWAEITLHIPATAISKVDGQDYSAVPREPATPAPRYVLATDTRLRPPVAELHQATCWTLDKPAAWLRITPIPDAAQARDQARIPGTLICTGCTPEP
jgi:hypothetical protein